MEFEFKKDWYEKFNELINKTTYTQNKKYFYKVLNASQKTVSNYMLKDIMIDDILYDKSKNDIEKVNEVELFIEEKMKEKIKIYMISRIILSILTFILFSILIRNEDFSWIIVPFIFSIAVFLLSFPSTIIAKKIMRVGSSINNILLKIIYYVMIPIISLLICFILYIGIQLIFDTFLYTPTNDLSAELTQAFYCLFLICIVVIAIILPYIQAIIINILNKIIK